MDEQRVKDGAGDAGGGGTSTPSTNALSDTMKQWEEPTAVPQNARRKNTHLYPKPGQ